MAIIDLGAELKARMESLPNKGLDQIKQYLKSVGRGAFADTLVGVFWTTDTPAPVSGSLGVQLSNFRFGQVTTSETAAVVARMVVHNGTDLPQEKEFGYTYTETQQFEFGFSEGLTIGTKAGANVEVPGFGGVEVEISAEFQFTADQRWTSTTSTEINMQDQFAVPPHTTVTAVSVTSIGHSNVPFTATAVATSGTFGFDCFQRFLPNVPTAIIWAPVVNMLPDTGARTFQVAGTVSGAMFLDNTVDLTQGPVDKALVKVVSRGLAANQRDTGLSAAAGGL